ncbi:hypothetical protein BDN72DRAFT_898604 [Pluteus cervinus]|uniref:Uncharacterized protein n=1 Tax=Pluteus cervinus TaxID=181527 RepID=A0ACD3AQ45_9AGAR|nr:hypothetical protein BDN72DRAFT_898604 [Pluteus cervinus]
MLGKSVIKALLSLAYGKLKGVTGENEANQVLAQVNMFAFYLCVRRGGPSGSSSSEPKNPQIIGGRVAPRILLALSNFSCSHILRGRDYVLNTDVIARNNALCQVYLCLELPSQSFWKPTLMFTFQVESSIPRWEWGIPQKTAKKQKHKNEITGGGLNARIEEVDDSPDSCPRSRAVRVDEVDDDDDA